MITRPQFYDWCDRNISYANIREIPGLIEIIVESSRVKETEAKVSLYLRPQMRADVQLLVRSDKPPVVERQCNTCARTCDVGVACWWCGNK